MKTRNRYHIFILTFAALMLGAENWGWGQEKADPVPWPGSGNKLSTGTVTLTMLSSGRFTASWPSGTYDYIDFTNDNWASSTTTATNNTITFIFKFTDKDHDPFKVKLIDFRGSSNTASGGYGLKLVLQHDIPSGVSRTKPTLQRYDNNGSELIPVSWLGESTKTAWLVIQGTTSNQFIIDGGSGGLTASVSGNDYSATHPTEHGEIEATSSLIYSPFGGKFDLEYVTFQNNWNNNASKTYSALEFGSTTTHRRALEVSMQYVTIKNCYAENGGAAMFINATKTMTSSSGNTLTSTLTMQNCTIENCFAKGDDTGKGGIIRTHTSTNTMPITVTNCTFRNNYNRWVGGAITWWSSADLTLQGCTFENNHARYCSGAIEADNLVLKNCIIQNNTVCFHSGYLTEANYGGAVFVKKSLKVSGLTKIKDNTLSGNYNPAVSSKNVYFYSDSDYYVTIDTDGLDCGSSIGVSSNNVASNNRVATGSTANCQKAYRNHSFFDDAGTKNVYLLSSNQTNLYFQSDWCSQAATAGTDYVLSDGFVSQINTAAGMAYFAKDVNSGKNYSGHTVVLNNDINLAGNSWCPIGYKGDCDDAPATCAFSGIFDGQGHTISGPTTTISTTYDNLGLFGYSTGTITNTWVVSGTLNNASAKNIGGLVAKMHGGTISNSGASCALTGGNKTVIGGLVGMMEGGTVQYCTASGTLTHPSSNYDGDNIAGGLVGRTTSGSTSTIHSCSAMAEMYGYTMGGIVGILGEGCALYNSYANPLFIYLGNSTHSYYVGGLVGTNTGSPSSSSTTTNPGTVQNCYVRFSRPNTNLVNAFFGRLAGRAIDNTAVSSCYWPTGTISSVPNRDKYDGANLTTSCYQYNTSVVAPYLYSHTVDFTLTSDASKNLLDELNRWVGSSSTYSKWKRTTAGGYVTNNGATTGGNINGDYPIHKYSGYTCVASTDGVNLDYAATLDAMLTRHTSDATINLYANDETSKSTGSNVMVYIDEDVSLLQTDATKDITAYTSQTLKRYSDERWHNFSSSLKESKIGISYTNNAQVNFSWASDPCGIIFSRDDDNALFPSDIPVASMDLYSFYEPEYHWINFRRNSLSHWHENAHDVKINYNGNGINTSVAPYTSYSNNGNEPILVPGKGYLVSIDKEQLVQNKGILNNGNVTLCNVTKTDANAWAGLLGFNLLGNPYQSYLDFEKFIDDGEGTNNGENLWESTSEHSEYNNTFAVFDPSLNAYRQYKKNSSYGSYGTSQYLHPHQGFFIRMTKGDASANSTTVKYTNAMRTNDANTAFRGDNRVAYPLVNFLVRDSEYNGDVAVLELGRDSDEGALKMRMGECMGRISLGYEGDDYGILFRNEVEDYQSLRFEATEAGTFTLTWNTANANFEALTLIDNIAGTETDMLASDTYCFEATSDQYPSRFKVVIGDYKGIDENEENGPSTDSGTFNFAFQMGDRLVVNGEGILQIIDMLGRVVMTDQTTGSQSTTSLPKTAGVYVLRLTNTNGTKTQKMIVK